MKQEVKIGQQDYTVLVLIRDSTTGAPKTALTFASAGMDVGYTRVETDNDVTWTDGAVVDLATPALTDPHLDWGFLKVDDAKAPGLYRLDIADGVFAPGAWSAVVSLVCTGCDPVQIEFTLVPSSPYVGVQLDPAQAATTFASLSVTGQLDAGNVLVDGTTVLTGAVGAGATSLASLAVTGALSVGTTTTLTGAVSLGGALTVTGTTTLAAVTQVGAVSLGATTIASAAITGALSVGTTTTLTGAVAAPAGITANITGNITGTLATVTAVTNGVTIAVGGIIAGANAAAELNAIADAFLDRNMATGVDSGTDSTITRTPRQGLRVLRNKRVVAAGVLTVRKEDDATASWTAAIATAAGDPVSSVDPT